MIQSGEQINNNLIESQLGQRVIWELQRKEQALQLVDQFVSVENPEKKLPNPEHIDWSFVAAKNAHVERSVDLHQLAQALGQLGREPRGTGSSELRGPTEGAPEDGGQNLEGLPIYARWFKFNATHKIERQSLPEFFGEKPSKSPAVYLKMRNFMVQAYWRSPTTYLTATACRRCISGDAPAVLRVHAFLEGWGVINLFATPSSQTGLARDPAPLPLFTTSTDRGGKAEPSASRELLGTALRRLAEGERPMPQRCFQCQGSIDRAWHTLSSPTNRAEAARISICDDCFTHNRYPIFFGPENWRRESVDQLFPLTADQQANVSIEDQSRLLEGLKEAQGELALDPRRLPALGTEEIRALLARAPAEGTNPVLSEQLRGIPSSCQSYTQLMTETFDRQLAEISESLGASAKENGKAILTEQHQVQQRSLERQRQLGELFTAKAEKVSVRLRFFEEAERIIYHERQNLGLL